MKCSSVAFRHKHCATLLQFISTWYSCWHVKIFVDVLSFRYHLLLFHTRLLDSCIKTKTYNRQIKQLGCDWNLWCTKLVFIHGQINMFYCPWCFETFHKSCYGRPTSVFRWWSSEFLHNAVKRIGFDPASWWWRVLQKYQNDLIILQVQESRIPSSEQHLPRESGNFDALYCWSVVKKTAEFTDVNDNTQLETKFSEVCSGVWKQGSFNELLKINDKKAIYIYI